MDEIERYIDRLLRPYHNIIDVSEQKKQLMLGLDKKAAMFRHQGYDHEEIDCLIKNSLLHLWHEIEKEISVDKRKFVKKSRLHILGYLILILGLMMPGILAGGHLWLPSIIIGMIIICILSYLMAERYSGLIHINVYKLKYRKRELMVFWLVFLFISSVVCITEYEDGRFTYTQLVINMYFLLVTGFIPIALYRIDCVIKKCLKC